MTQTSWGEIEDLLLAAVERTADDYERFVRRTCQDPILRDTITALRRGGSVPSGDGQTTLPLSDAAPALTSASRVGPYVVVHRLGRGGMGEVFLARDSRLDRAVALKCLLAAGAAPQDLRDRVVREARLAARINHPHVAAVHDVVEHDGRTFMVMEYVEGESLAAVLKREPLAEGRVVELGRQLAAALAAAHRVGIIHRDLKPANIQVTPDGSVKVLDFGIATAYAALASATTKTAAGVDTHAAPVHAGTPGYMSPEQMLGLALDERSDIFSLSVVLFEMATGRRPVESRDALDILLATIRVLPRVDGTGRHLSERLADVIATGLAADPSRRFQSAAEMGAALEAIGKPGAADARPGRRIAWPVAAIALVPALVWALGRISSAGYNTTLERAGAFASERPIDDVVWGAKSLVAPCVYAGLAIVFAWAVRFAVRLVALWTPAARRLAAFTRHARAAADRLAMYDPIVLAQGLASLGLLALAVAAWRFNRLMLAWGATISTGPTEAGRLWPLSPDNETERILYRFTLTVLLLLFAAGLARVIQLRRRLGTRRGAGSLGALIAVVVSLLLLIELPYRIFFHSTAMLVDFRGMRCYVIGDDHDGARSLLYCPDSKPPRNTIVDRRDPALRPSGSSESIFTPPVR
jgi:serine/threonine protein kinase